MEVFYSNQFHKDLIKLKKQGKNLDKLQSLMSELVQDKPLGTKHRDHKLIGNYKDRRECHIEPDWLLIYKKTSSLLIFERSGSHSELFK